MSVSKKNKTPDLVSVNLKVGGKALKEFYQILSIESSYQINKLSWLKVEIIDGNPAQNNFEISSKKEFSSGEKISVSLGHHSDTNSIFEGIIVNHRLKISQSADGHIVSRMILYCQHDTIKLLNGLKNRNFKDKKDSDAIASILGEHTVKNKIVSTTVSHENLVQFSCSDWDFILKRSQSNGLIVLDSNKQLEIAKPLSKKSNFIVEYGRNVISMDLELRGENQSSKVNVSSWDSASQKLVESNAKEPKTNLKLSKTPDKVAEKIDDLSIDLSSSAAYEKDELQAWADGVLLDSRMSYVFGEVCVPGDAKINPNETVELKGFGDRFNGDIPVYGVRHSVRRGVWVTTLIFGLNSELKKEKNESLHLMNSVLPTISGLQVGVVKKLEGDPKSEYRVLVTIPAFKESEGVWARISHLHATKGAGTFFIPEENDEVILGFLSDDPRHPIILGSLYSKKNTPASDYKITSDNKKKSIITPDLFKIEFDGDKKTLTLETPKKNKIVMNDDEKAIHITDCNDNKLDMTSSGIDLSSAKDIKIKATGSLSLSANQKVSIESSGGDVEAKGLNVTHTANVKLTLKGSAAAELNGGAMLEVKGGIVKIN